MSFPQVKIFIIDCSTGCSCCNYENHSRGPYSTREIAEKRVEHFKSIPLLSSQFSRTGNYHINEEDGELLPDGRIISGSRIFEGFKDDGLDDRIDR